MRAPGAPEEDEAQEEPEDQVLDEEGAVADELGHVGYLVPTVEDRCRQGKPHASTIMWMRAPRKAGPMKNSKFEPPMVALFIDDIMPAGEMNTDAMW